MKKILLVLALIALSVFMLASCTAVVVDEVVDNDVKVDEADVAPEVVPEAAEEEKVMTYAEYVAAELESEVVIDAYVQGKQSWWDNKATVYTQDEDGAYFLYEMACSEEDYALLENGTHIKVKGYKAEWAGEVEIVDATFEIIEGNFVAEAVDATAWLGTDELALHQNEVVAFKGMTVESVSYKNDQPGDDIYVTFSKDGANYDFCVEYYLTGTETDGPNAHITSVAIAE